jgi:ferredoxin-NADP reductase
MASVLEVPSDTTFVSAGPMVPRPFVVKRFRKETDDTFTLELEPKEGRSRFVFGPGQFNMVYVYGVGEVPISISGSPSTPGLIHTTRAVGTVTKAMAKLKKGDIVGIRGPYGTTWPVKEARSHDVVIVAGGIGLPPLRGAIYEILCMEYGHRRISSSKTNWNSGVPGSTWRCSSQSIARSLSGEETLAL